MVAIEANRRLPQPILETHRLRLRPLMPEDLTRVAQLANDPEIAARTVVIPYPYERQHADYWLANSRAERERGEAITYAIAHRETDDFIGSLCLTLMTEVEKSVLLGYWLERSAWGKGIMTEALRCALHFSFTELDCNSAYAMVLPKNEASIGVLRKLGFRTFPIELIPRDSPLFPALGLRLARVDFLAAQSVTNLLVVSAAALIDNEGRILLTQRPEGKPFAGLWEFPGGKVNAHETPEAAIVRELQEELGVTVYPSSLAPFSFASHSYPQFHLVMPLYLCRIWEGEPQGKEGQRLAWIPAWRLSDYPILPADLPLVAQLRALF